MANVARSTKTFRFKRMKRVMGGRVNGQWMDDGRKDAQTDRRKIILRMECMCDTLLTTEVFLLAEIRNAILLTNAYGRLYLHPVNPSCTQLTKLLRYVNLHEISLHSNRCIYWTRQQILWPRLLTLSPFLAIQFEWTVPATGAVYIVSMHLWQ
jgi:hypothetical protein